MKIRFKNDYTKKYSRQQITTTIRKDLYKQFKQLSVNINEPTSKMWDVLLLELFDDKISLNNFVDKIKLY